MHVAFTVDTREEVDTFYRAAIDAGASSRESPGVHPEYYVDYYGGAMLTDGASARTVPSFLPASNPAAISVTMSDRCPRSH